MSATTTAIIVTVVIIVAALAFAVGYYFYHKNQQEIHNRTHGQVEQRYVTQNIGGDTVTMPELVAQRHDTGKYEILDSSVRNGRIDYPTGFWRLNPDGTEESGGLHQR